MGARDYDRHGDPQAVSQLNSKYYSKAPDARLRMEFFFCSNCAFFRPFFQSDRSYFRFNNSRIERFAGFDAIDGSIS
jgi:hypothetical protein